MADVPGGKQRENKHLPASVSQLLKWAELFLGAAGPRQEGFPSHAIAAKSPLLNTKSQSHL